MAFGSGAREVISRRLTIFLQWERIHVPENHYRITTRPRARQQITSKSTLKAKFPRIALLWQIAKTRLTCAGRIRRPPISGKSLIPLRESPGTFRPFSLVPRRRDIVLVIGALERDARDGCLFPHTHAEHVGYTERGNNKAAEEGECIISVYQIFPRICKHDRPNRRRRRRPRRRRSLPMKNPIFIRFKGPSFTKEISLPFWLAAPTRARGKSVWKQQRSSGWCDAAAEM